MGTLMAPLMLLALVAAGLGGILHFSTSYACYCIGSPPGLDEALKYRIVIVDPDEAPQWLVDNLTGSGRIVLAYVNIGYAESWRSYWNNSSIAGIVHDETEYEGEYFVEYWSEEWHSLMRGLAEEYLSRGYSGIYMDNVDAYEYIESMEPPWAAGVDPRGEMLALVSELAELVHSLGGLAYANIGGALLDLGGGPLVGVVDGYLREEHFLSLEDACHSRPRPPMTVLMEGLVMLSDRLHGMDVIVVEFVENRREGVLAALGNLVFGATSILQPACDPDYMGPPIVLGFDSHDTLSRPHIAHPDEASLPEPARHPAWEVPAVHPPGLACVVEEDSAPPENPVELPVEVHAVEVSVSPREPGRVVDHPVEPLVWELPHNLDHVAHHGLYAI